MDRITQQLLGEFSADNNIAMLPEETRFEHLTAFLTVRRHYGRAFVESADIDELRQQLKKG
jgi:hypothetical protein